MATAAALLVSTPAIAAPVAQEARPAAAPSEATPAAEEPAPAEPAAVDPADAEWAETRSAAAAHYAEGKALFSEGRYLEAAGQFERSHARVDYAATLHKIVDAYEAANEPLRTMQKTRQFLALPICEGGKENATNYPCGEPRRRDNMLARAERLRKVLGELKLQLADGVELREVRVADKVVPLSDFPLLVLPGSFIVEMHGPLKDQHRSYNVTVDGGEIYSVFVPPFVEPTIAGPVVGPDDGEGKRLQRERRQRIAKGAFWGGLGLTVASGAALGVLGGLTRNRRQTFKDLQDEYISGGEPPVDPMCDAQYPCTAEAEFNDFKRATNAMIGVTAGLGLTTVVLGIFAFTKQGSGGANASLQVRAVRLGLRPGGIVVRW